MVKYVIRGGRKLRGEVKISGAKNAAVAILPAALLADGPSVIENVPQITDVTVMLEIISELGARVRLLDKSTVEIDPTGLRNLRASTESMRRMRASYYVLGVLLGKFGSAVVGMPGGCDIGVRAIDQHIKGFQALGADVDVAGGFIHAVSRDGQLHGSQVYFDQPSVGATINMMLAAVLTEGLTVIENAAKEPHVVDLANFLNTAGGDVRGAGTDVIKIRGVERLNGCTYSIIPDQIEAGTFIAAAAATGSEITLRGVIPKHLECITAKFTEIGTSFYEDPEDPEAVIVAGPETIHRTNVKTLPYPGFPTDMQSQISTVLCLAEGASVITETIFDNRFRYTDELKRMGAKIQVDGKVAVIEGTGRLTGAQVRACDLRAGAAMVVAGLAAEGVTEIEGVNYIERGYENFTGKLKGLGADVQVVTLPDADAMTEAG